MLLQPCKPSYLMMGSFIPIYARRPCSSSFLLSRCGALVGTPPDRRRHTPPDLCGSPLSLSSTEQSTAASGWVPRVPTVGTYSGVALLVTSNYFYTLLTLDFQRYFSHASRCPPRVSSSDGPRLASFIKPLPPHSRPCCPPFFPCPPPPHPGSRFFRNYFLCLFSVPGFITKRALLMLQLCMHTCLLE